MDGVINVYKEKGYTSFDVVAKLRGILHQKKIGHTGTLDPDAEGVLVVCLGKATKLCDVITDKNKEYETIMLLGTETDTEDISGKILHQSKVDISEEAVVRTLNNYIGTYQQVPPMYSAIKQGGHRLYELARQGQVVERDPRTVTIYSIKIIDIQLPRVTFKVSCSKGTYIRSLCRDIGKTLGCGACMEQLLRRQVSGFSLEDSLTLSEIEVERDEGTLLQHIRTIDSMFPNYPHYHIHEKYEKYLMNGNKLYASQFTQKILKSQEDPFILVYNTAGIFCAIYKWESKKQEYVPDKMFI